MSSKPFKSALGLFLLFCAAMPWRLSAQPPDLYARALGDLRTAYVAVRSTGGGERLSQDESSVLDEIKVALADLKAAGVDDRRDFKDFESVELPRDRLQRLDRGRILLLEAHDDVARREADPHDREFALKVRSHIDAALRHLGNAMEDLRHRHG